MIGIAVVFLLIGYMEWLYLRRDRRETRTIRLVLGLGAVMLVCSEAVFLTRNSGMTIGLVLNEVFAPVQRLLFAGS